MIKCTCDPGIVKELNAAKIVSRCFNFFGLENSGEYFHRLKTHDD